MGASVFSVPRMRNQQIFEANSGFKICLLRFHFSTFEAKTGLKFEVVFGLKNRVGLYGFQACSGTFFLCLCPWSAQEISQLGAQGLVLNDGLLASDSTHPATKLESHLAQPTL